MKNKIYKIAVLLSAALLLSGCSDKSENQSATEISLPLTLYEEEFLYKDIPSPTAADVFILPNSADDEYEHYSFTFENFTLDEAKSYIALLEDTVVDNREMYDVYTKNDFPILNYVGRLNNDSAISLSQSGTGGAITINVKKSVTNAP